MFTSLGLFTEIPCPAGSNCLLVNCIFSHQSTNNSANQENGDAIYDPSAIAERLSPPPSKRRRVDENLKPADATLQRQSARDVANHPEALAPEHAVARLPKARTSQAEAEAQGSNSGNNSHDRLQISVSARKSVSPPPIRRTASQVPAKAKESLNPRKVPHPPQKHEKRKALLATLHATMVKLNEKLLSDQKAKGSFVFSSDELISMATEEEERMALATKDEDSYRTIVGQRIMKFRKMGVTEWKELVLEYSERMLVKQKNAKGVDMEQRRVEMGEEHSGEFKKPDNAQPVFSTTLTSKQEIAILQYIRTPVDGLADYVTKPPSEMEIASARRALETCRGSEVCDRCKSRYTVFPGRNPEGKLTSGGTCHYHWAKLPKFVSDATYDCCHKPAGAEPC